MIEEYTEETKDRKGFFFLSCSLEVRADKWNVYSDSEIEN